MILGPTVNDVFRLTWTKRSIDSTAMTTLSNSRANAIFPLFALCTLWKLFQLNGSKNWGDECVSQEIC